MIRCADSNLIKRDGQVTTITVLADPTNPKELLQPLKVKQVVKKSMRPTEMVVVVEEVEVTITTTEVIITITEVEVEAAVGDEVETTRIHPIKPKGLLEHQNP